MTKLREISDYLSGVVQNGIAFSIKGMFILISLYYTDEQ